MYKINIMNKPLKLTEFEERDYPEEKDIIVDRISTEQNYNENGDLVIKNKKERINLTKKINECAKLINEINTQERLNSIEEEIENELTEF